MYKSLIVVLYHFFSLSLNLSVKKDYEIHYLKKKICWSKFDKRERNNVKDCAHFLFYEFFYLFLRFFYYIIYFQIIIC